MNLSNTGMLKTYLKNSLQKLEMNDPCALNKQVQEEEAKERLRLEMASAAEKEKEGLAIAMGK